jgi:hypothetical protein
MKDLQGACHFNNPEVHVRAFLLSTIPDPQRVLAAYERQGLPRPPCARPFRGLYSKTRDRTLTRTGADCGKALTLGGVTVMPLGTRTFRIFVSSTFTDLKEERNALQERVFPRLKEYCLQHGARFQAIDLRWGVSEEAGYDQQTINICLEEIDRCRKTSPRPNFIVLLGDRYGWQPPPPQIPSYEFEEILRSVSPEEVRLLREWYLRDDNAVPIESDPSQFIWYLKPREGEFKKGSLWFPIEQQLRAILEKAVTEMALESFDRLKYETSATHQEIDRGALRVEEDHVFCFFRSIEELPSDESAKGFIDLGSDNRRDEHAAARLKDLKTKLGNLFPNNVRRYTARWIGADPHNLDQSHITLDHISQLCEDVYDALLAIIKQEIDKIEEVDRVDREVETHENFADDRARHFTGRVDILDRIGAYVDNPDGKPLVMFGASGSGKSAVVGRAAQLARESHSDAVVIRFIGATPDSADGRALLDSLAHEISRRYGGDTTTVPTDYQELVRDFPERLALASAQQRRLILFLDALDQLSATGGARNLSWLPTDLPPGVGVVVSTTLGETLDPLRTRLPDSSLIELKAMEPAEGVTLLDRWLKDAGRILQEHQRREVLTKFEAERLPLWLKLAFEEARRWRSSAEFPEIELPPSVSEIIRKKLFDRLDDDENHGKVMVSRSLGYLGAAKNGLTEDEMLDVLSLGGWDGPVLEDYRRRSPESPEVDTLPVVVWSRLYLDLEPYLTERTADGASLMTFYHRQVGEAVGEEYLAGQEALDRHRELASYFATQELEIGDESPIPNLRTMSELPYQQTKGELWNDLFNTLTDFNFLEKKAMHAGVIESTDAQGSTVNTYTGIYQIRDDYALALKGMPGSTSTAGDDQRRRIIVTGVDFGEGLAIQCPHCNVRHPFSEEWKGQEIQCPNANCKGPLRVNPFVVERR